MRRYAVAGTATSAELDQLVRTVAKEFEQDGFVPVESVDEADFVLNMFDAENPKAFRRKARETCSAAFYELGDAPQDVLKASYPCWCGHFRTSSSSTSRGKAWFTTMEQGTYKVSEDYKDIYARLARSRSRSS